MARIEVDIEPNLKDGPFLADSRRLHEELERQTLRSARSITDNMNAAYLNVRDTAVDAAEKVGVAETRLTEVRARAERQGNAVAAAERNLANLRSSGTADLNDIAKAERELDTIREKHGRTIVQLSTASAAASRAHRAEASAIRDLRQSFDDAHNSVGIFSRGLNGIAQIGGGKLLMGGLAGGLVELGGVAASASQSLWLLPGAVGALGTAFATLKIGIGGLDDVFKSMGDPEKFAESLQHVSPQAQQLALHIRDLMPEFTALKNSVQDNLLAGMGPEVEKLTNQYLPALKSGLGGVASAMNNGVKGVAETLLSPEGMANVNNLLANTTSAFQNASGAAAPLVKAFTDIASTGSDFLPGIAQAATNAATAFSKFIEHAKQTGELKKWMTEGLDTLKRLGGIASDLGHAFANLAPLAHNALTVLEGIGSTVKNVTQWMGQHKGVVDAATVAVGLLGTTWLTAKAALGGQAIWQTIKAGLDLAIGGFNTLAGTARTTATTIATTSAAEATAIGGVTTAAGGAATAIGGVAVSAEAAEARMAKLPILMRLLGLAGTVAIPTVAGNEIANGISGEDHPWYWAIQQGFQAPGKIWTGITHGGDINGGDNAPPPVPSGPVNPGDVFAGPYGQTQSRNGPHGGRGMSTNVEERQKTANSTALPPEMQIPVPQPTGGPGGSGGPKLPEAPVTPYDMSLPGGSSNDPSIFSAQSSWLDARHSLEEKQARLNQLEQSNVATADDITKAKNDVIEAQRDMQGAELRLSEARKTQYEQQTKEQQKFEKQALGTGNGAAGGFWAQFGQKMGEALAQIPFGGLLRGPIEQAGRQADAANGYPSVGYGYGYPGSYTPPGSGLSALDQATIQLAANANGGSYGWGDSDLKNMVADCSGAVSDLVEMETQGYTTPQRLFSTGNEAQVLQSRGFVPGFVPGQLNIGFKNGGPGGGHTAATLPNGVNFESGGSHGGIAYGGPAAGAMSPQFTDHYTLPAGNAYSPAGLNGPPPIGGAPNIARGSGGQGPAFPAGPSMRPYGSPVGQDTTRQPTSTGGEGIGITQGGPIDMGIGAAAAAANAFAPGSGIAVQKGAQLGERAMKFGGQLIGIGVEGLLETFGLSGSPIADPSKSWIGRLGQGIGGVKAATGNTAGQTQAPMKPDEQKPGQQPPQGPPAPLVHIETQNNNSGDGGEAARDTARTFTQYQGGGSR